MLAKKRHHGGKIFLESQLYRRLSSAANRRSVKAANSNISATGRIRSGKQAPVPRWRDQLPKSQKRCGRQSLDIRSLELLWMLEPVRLSLPMNFKRLPLRGKRPSHRLTRIDTDSDQPSPRRQSPGRVHWRSRGSPASGGLRAGFEIWCPLEFARRFEN